MTNIFIRKWCKIPEFASNIKNISKTAYGTSENIL